MQQPAATTNSGSPGKVYIASMNLRGEWAKAPENALKVNVTSAQARNNINRLTFSPMTPISGGYCGFYNFEAFWQSGKVFEGIPEEKSKAFWHSVVKPTRRYPGSKGHRVLYARFECAPNEKMDYITSRKKIYIPRYYDLIKDTPALANLRARFARGESIVIYDFDGPRVATAQNTSGVVECRELSLELLQEKVNDPRFPFGHGYIVAAAIVGEPLAGFTGVIG